MTDRVWVVGKVVGRGGDGEVVWRTMGIFVDKATAAQWAGHVKADLLLAVEAGTALPGLGDLSASLMLAQEAD